MPAVDVVAPDEDTVPGFVLEVMDQSPLLANGLKLRDPHDQTLNRTRIIHRCLRAPRCVKVYARLPIRIAYVAYNAYLASDIDFDP
jgi:hypothetical protein